MRYLGRAACGHLARTLMIPLEIKRSEAREIDGMLWRNMSLLSRGHLTSKL
jgi:hypothetical protein